MMMVVFTVFFGRLAGVSDRRASLAAVRPAGLLPWTFFVDRRDQRRPTAWSGPSG